MKCAVVLAEGVKQIMLSPESDNEKMALKMIEADSEITVERKTGSFYDDENSVRGYSVNMCQGDYLRAFSQSDCLMLVIKPVTKELEK